MTVPDPTRPQAGFIRLLLRMTPSQDQVQRLPEQTQGAMTKASAGSMWLAYRPPRFLYLHHHFAIKIRWWHSMA